MDEIKIRFIIDAVEDRRRLSKLSLIPPHVRHFEVGGYVEPHDIAAQDCQTFILTVLETLVEQELQPQADAEEWRSTFDGSATWLD